MGTQDEIRTAHRFNHEHGGQKIGFYRSPSTAPAQKLFSVVDDDIEPQIPKNRVDAFVPALLLKVLRRAGGLDERTRLLVQAA